MENDQPRWEDLIAVSVPLFSKFRNICSGAIIAVLYRSRLGECGMESESRL